MCNSTRSHRPQTPTKQKIVSKTIKYTQKHNKELIAGYKENFPDEPLPDHFTHDFDINIAFASMCEEILLVRKQLDKTIDQIDNCD